MGMSEGLELERLAAVAHRSFAREGPIEDPTVPALNILQGPSSHPPSRPLDPLETPAHGAVVYPTRPVDTWRPHPLTGPVAPRPGSAELLHIGSPQHPA